MGLEDELKQFCKKHPEANRKSVNTLKLIRDTDSSLHAALLREARAKHKSGSAQKVLNEYGHTTPTVSDRVADFMTYSENPRKLGETLNEWISRCDRKLLGALKSKNHTERGKQSSIDALAALGHGSVDEFLQDDVDSFVAQNPRAIVDGRAVLKEFRRESLLFQRLTVFAQDEYGVNNPSLAIRYFGVLPPLRLTESRIREVLYQAIPPRIALKALTFALEESVDVKKRLLALGLIGGKVYSACFNPKRADNVMLHKKYPDQNGLDARLDDMYGHLRDLHGGRSLVPALKFEDLDHDTLQRLVRMYVFSGKDLSFNSMSTESPRGARLATAIQKSPPLDLVDKSFSDRLAAIAAFPKSKRTYLAKSHYFSDTDVVTDGPNMGQRVNANVLTGRLVESQFSLLLQAAQFYDPSHNSFDEAFNIITPEKIIDVDTQLQNRSNTTLDTNEISDGRVTTDTETSIVVEVKHYKYLRSRKEFANTFSKYTNVRWADGEKIDKKVAFINSKDSKLSERANELEHRGWDVILPSQFATLYDQTLELLLESEPRFFTNGPIPTSQTILRELHDMLRNQPHLLNRRGHKQYREWARDMFDANLGALAVGDFSYERESVQIPKRTVSSFSSLSHIYGDTSREVVEDVLFYDLETAGVQNSGSPIYVLGLGYASGDEMKIEVLHAEHFYDEKRLLQRFVEMSQRFKYRCTYNGLSFDEPYVLERAVAWGVPIPEKEHIDLYPQVRAQRNGGPKKISNKLTSIEKQMYDYARANDVAGEFIPEVWTEYIYKGFSEGSKAALLSTVDSHNLIDVATTIATGIDSGYFPDGTPMRRK